MNKMHVIHLIMYFISSKVFELVILVSVMSTVWEDTDGCSKQYRCSLAIYLMTVLSYLYGIIMDRAMNSPRHGKSIVDGLNDNDKFYLREKMELLGKLKMNETLKIRIRTSA